MPDDARKKISQHFEKGVSVTKPWVTDKFVAPTGVCVGLGPSAACPQSMGPRNDQERYGLAMASLAHRGQRNGALGYHPSKDALHAGRGNR